MLAGVAREKIEQTLTWSRTGRQSNDDELLESECAVILQPWLCPVPYFAVRLKCTNQISYVSLFYGNDPAPTPSGFPITPANFWNYVLQITHSFWIMSGYSDSNGNSFLPTAPPAYAVAGGVITEVCVKVELPDVKSPTCMIGAVISSPRFVTPVNEKERISMTTLKALGRGITEETAQEISMIWKFAHDSMPDPVFFPETTINMNTASAYGTQKYPVDVSCFDTKGTMSYRTLIDSAALSIDWFSGSFSSGSIYSRSVFCSYASIIFPAVTGATQYLPCYNLSIPEPPLLACCIHNGIKIEVEFEAHNFAPYAALGTVIATDIYVGIIDKNTVPPTVGVAGVSYDNNSSMFTTCGVQHEYVIGGYMQVEASTIIEQPSATWVIADNQTNIGGRGKIVHIPDGNQKMPSGTTQTRQNRWIGTHFSFPCSVSPQLPSLPLTYMWPNLSGTGPSVSVGMGQQMTVPSSVTVHYRGAGVRQDALVVLNNNIGSASISLKYECMHTGSVIPTFFNAKLNQ